MGDDPQTEGTAERNPANTPRLPQDRDWLLAEIVHFTNQGIEFDITIMVGGQMMTGRTISSTNYFEMLAKNVEDTLGLIPEEDRELISSFSTYYRNFKKLGVTPPDAPEDFVMTPPQYMHLQNAKVVGEQYDTPHEGEGILWRGRISAVSGFSLTVINRKSRILGTG